VTQVREQLPVTTTKNPPEAAKYTDYTHIYTYIYTQIYIYLKGQNTTDYSPG